MALFSRPLVSWDMYYIKDNTVIVGYVTEPPCRGVELNPPDPLLEPAVAGNSRIR